MNNIDRANRARIAIGAYSPSGGEERVRDLICDLRHLADRTQLDWDEEYRVAMDNYASEIQAYGTDADRAKLKGAGKPMRIRSCWICSKPLRPSQVVTPDDEEPMCADCKHDADLEAGRTPQEAATTAPTNSNETVHTISNACASLSDETQELFDLVESMTNGEQLVANKALILKAIQGIKDSVDSINSVACDHGWD